MAEVNQTPYAIEMLHITKRFPGIIANDDISLQLKKGEIHALLGENGAGKSTLMSVLFGLYQPEEGEIRKDGVKVEIHDPNDANALGIGMVHQHFKLVECFSVLDNIILGVEPNKFGFLQKAEAREKVIALSEKYGALFCGYADSAPINEVKAAAYAGLGMRGDNGMLINEKYGSYVFIGAIYTDAVFEYGGDKTSNCPHCGRCRAACPMKDGRECLSAVTQKKGELTDEEIAYIRQYGSAWGCDICGDVCPFSAAAVKNNKTTPIGFFYEDRTPFLTRETLGCMTETRFSERAYAWRGKAVIERNIAILKSGDSAER